MRKRSTARWLWHRGQPIDGTLAERYLRDARALTCPLPQTFRYLPATEGYPPALLAPFGMPVEPEPGVIAMPDEHVTGLLSVSLGPDGGKIEKRSLGICVGSPIQVSPWTDSLGLVIAEGIEDALSGYEATGLAAWAAGGASFLPALADAVPVWVDAITIFEDDNDAGRRGTAALAERLRGGGFDARVVNINRDWRGTP